MCENCPAGTYCLSGEGVQLCPAGHYCLGGGVEGILPCPPGTYSPMFGLSQVEQCLICPAGEGVVIRLSVVLPASPSYFKINGTKPFIILSFKRVFLWGVGPVWTYWPLSSRLLLHSRYIAWIEIISRFCYNMNLNEVIPFFKVWTSQTWMVTSVLEWEELVHRGNTVPRALAYRCPAHQEPSPTGGFTLRIYRM